MDKSEFEKQFTLCKTALERFIYYKMHSKADSDDIIQEVALTAYRKMDGIIDPEKFKPWILKIAANKCNDYYRNLARKHEIPLDEMTDTIVSMNRYGISETEIVGDILDNLADKDKQILFLYYFKSKPQTEIAELLKIPIGTVKSRLHTAKQNFKEAYPFPPNQKPKSIKSKGENIMKILPDILPAYKIIKSEKPPFSVRCEETPGWFIIPRLGEKITWAIYDLPMTERKRSETTHVEVTGKASVHGIEGVEIIATEQNPLDFNATDGNKTVERRYVAQLTDTHCRFLAESYMKNDIKYYSTFLDGDDFNMDFGEDNCGKEVDLISKGIIKKAGNVITCNENKQITDVVGRYDVEINGKRYDTVCYMDIDRYNPGVMSEQFIDRNGKTVLWRRFNKNDWKIERYNTHFKCKEKQFWSEMFPNNEQITVNGEIYVHWYDCITDYIL